MSLQEIPAGSTVTYSQQFRRCGNPECATCKAGGHGPYWYAYWREGGRRRSRYLGKHPPPSVVASTPRLDAPAALEPGVARAAPTTAGCRDTLRVRTLGAFQVWQEEIPLPQAGWRQRKVAALFKCLLSAPGLRLHRDQAIDWLWPEAGPVESSRLLHTTIHRLRRLLDRLGAAESHLQLAGDLLALVPAPGGTAPPAWCDADAFSQAAAAALAGDTLAACRAALALYTGDYLPEDRYADWAIARREALRRQRLDVLRHLAALCTAQGQVQGAIGALERLLQADPCDEVAACALLRLLAGAGRSAEARRLYQALTTTLRQELGLAPSATTRAVYQQVVPVDGQTLPTGTVSILLMDDAGESARPASLPERLALLVMEAGGTPVPLPESGDQCFVFARASDALAAACALQQAALAQSADAERGIRIAVHTGEAGLPVAPPGEAAHSAYETVIAHAARLEAAANAGQILLTAPTRALLRQTLPAGMRVRVLGAYHLAAGARPEPVYQVLHPALPGAFPPLRARQARSTNLPAALTSFVGREREQAVVAAAVTTARLVTLAGAGGCGKTRLALQVAGTLLTRHPDGVWLVELAALSDATLVPGAVAAALGVREEPGRPLLTTLTTQLQGKALLLVLDNCEHLVQGCAALAAHLLGQCPRVHILATSREPLGLGGETVWRVPSLTLPGTPQGVATTSGEGNPAGSGRGPATGADGGSATVAGAPHSAAPHRTQRVPGTRYPAPGTGYPDAEPPLADLLGYDAVQLFVERARASQPAFLLTGHSAPLVAQVCRRLDGLPLAIELAAARLSVLSLEQLAAKLDDRFRLLTVGSRDALPRQQTLRATMDWSYGLLSDAERLVLRRLSVFGAGGWTLEAAEAVCANDSPTSAGARGDAGIDRDEVLNLLSNLVAKSLVFVAQEGRTGRYGMLETVREYGLQHLEAAADAHSTRDRHLAWYATLVERAKQALLGPEQATWLDELEREHGNLRVALSWCLATSAGGDSCSSPATDRADRLATGLQLAANLLRFWQMRSHAREGRRWLEDLLARGGTAPPAIRADALNSAGALAYLQGAYEAAAEHYERCLALRRLLGDTRGVGVVLSNLGLVATSRGDYARALALHEESLCLRRETGGPRDVAVTLANLGEVTYHLGDVARATAYFQESLTMLSALGDRQSAAVLLGNLGTMSLLHGDPERAAARYEESIALYRAIGDQGGTGRQLANLAALALQRGDRARAAALYGESLDLAQSAADTVGCVICLEGLGALAGAYGHAAPAVRLLAVAATLRAARGEARPAPEQDAYVRALAAARAQLVDADFAAAQAAGQALSLEQAILLAREVMAATC